MDRSVESFTKGHTNSGVWVDDQFEYAANTFRQRGRVVAILYQTRYKPSFTPDRRAKSPWQPTGQEDPPAWSVAGAVVLYRQPQPQEPGNSWRFRTDIGFGWPYAGMGYRRDQDHFRKTKQISYGFDCSPADYTQTETEELPRVVPFRLLWPGFAINTFFYAAILWLPFAPFQLRRHLRVKRGLCIKCGYDLRKTSGGCPECGWGREAEA